MHGFISINKPPGITSFQAMKIAARTLGVKKAGHAGTLDPFAEGVLPVAVGEATKAVRFLHMTDKTYHAGIRFGALTDTLDITGKVIARSDPPDINHRMLEEVLHEFVGVTQQEPPAYSAIKIGGRRMYDLARVGEAPRVPSRPIVIHETHVIQTKGNEAVIEVRCGSGVYMRSLARDVGEKLNTHGILFFLTRISYGPFLLETSIAPDLVSWTEVIPILSALPHVQVMDVSSEGEALLRSGVIPDEGFFLKEIHKLPGHGILAVKGQSGELLAVIKVSANGVYKTERVFNV